MNRIIHKSLLAVLLALLSVMPCAAAETAAESALRSVLEGRYAAMKAAMAARDRQAIAALLAPDFVSVDLSGRSESAEQMLPKLAGMPDDPNKVSETTLLSVKLDGDVATVSQRYHMTTTKVDEKGVRHPVEIVTVSTDTWVRSGDTWRLQRTVTDQIDYTVDGRSVAHKVRSAAP
jgi:ketosteroid isomerase-like protein